MSIAPTPPAYLSILGMIQYLHSRTRPPSATGCSLYDPIRYPIVVTAIQTKQCRGIELVQGLADAANDHLQTVKACLTGPVPSTSGNDSTTTITNTEAKTAASASASSAGNNFTLSRSAGDTNETRRRSGGKGGKRGSTSKAANQGLSAPDLEALIVDLLKRLSSKEAGCGRHGGSSNDGEGSNRQEATAEDIAACLVRELGHRR